MAMMLGDTTLAQEGSDDGYADDDTVIATTLSPTLSPVSSPSQRNEPYLLIRPLQSIQVSLFGSIDSSRQDELLDYLKALLQQSFYRAMVEHFVPESEKEKLDNVFHRDNGMIDQNLIMEMSILSEVFLEWTATNLKLSNDPNMHILQASGSLGFSKYDYALLHPNTILSLEELVVFGDSSTNPVYFSSSINAALRNKGFYLMLLELEILVEQEPTPKPSPSPTPKPTVTRLENVHDSNSGMAKLSHHHHHHDGINSSVANKAGKVVIRTVLIVVTLVATFAFSLFVWFVKSKSNRIKKDLSDRKSRMSMKKTEDETDNGEGKKELDVVTGVPTSFSWDDTMSIISTSSSLSPTNSTPNNDKAPSSPFGEAFDMEAGQGSRAFLQKLTKLPEEDEDWLQTLSPVSYYVLTQEEEDDLVTL